jgi:glycosyltransferase involved in cell wall biosynthesis
MSPIRSITFITGGYPSEHAPGQYVFLRQFVHAVARQGVACTVVHPLAIQRAWGRRRWPYRSVERLDTGEEVLVLRPRYLSFSTRNVFSHLAMFNPGLLTLRNFVTAARRAMDQNQGGVPDAICGHFLYLGGAAAVRIGAALGIPSFPCVGEGEFWTVQKFGLAQAKSDLACAKAFLANSQRLKGMLQKTLGISPERTGVFPNGVDFSKFHRRDKGMARERYNLPRDQYLVACVGDYSYGKGVSRVGEALAGLDNVGGIFAGNGPVPPRGGNVLFNQRLAHDDIPDFLSAADVFVLPTLIEGCSNAIIEAMACGLPIISSRGGFNDDLLDETMSIRVDPLDIAAIRAAIVRLRDDPQLRQKMSMASRERSKRFDIHDRARHVLRFMNDQICDGSMPDPVGRHHA